MRQELQRQKWLKNNPLRSLDEVQWLKLRAANGIIIPYVGYAELNFAVGGIKIPDRGVVIVADDCLGAEKGVLGMNVILHCWKELFGGGHPGATAFKVTVSAKAKVEWEKAFAVCQKIEQAEAVDGRMGSAQLTRQAPIQIPTHSEMIVWTQVLEQSAHTKYCALIDASDEGNGWQVARTLSWVE
ncbi:UNVERIFIED_CONTAM: hypothetical protein FKN15_011152 [Acipenser sinensis]